MNTMQNTLQRLYDRHCRDNDSREGYLDFMDSVLEAFPDWNQQQAYIATEFLFRLENCN